MCSIVKANYWEKRSFEEYDYDLLQSDTVLSGKTLPTYRKDVLPPCRTARLRFPAWKDFSVLHSVQSGSGAHPASYTMSIGGLFPRGESGRRVRLTTHLHLM
jgi:hypothetical protein